MFSVLSSWLSFFSTLSLVVLIIVGIFMILVILMQRPKQEGLGAAFGGGMTNQMFGAHTTNVLEKLTFKLAILFIVLCFSRSILLAKQNQGVTLISEQPAVEQAVSAEGEVTEDEVENMVEEIKTQLEQEADAAKDAVKETATKKVEEAQQEAAKALESIPTDVAK